MFDKRSLKKLSWRSYCWFSADVTAAIFVDKNKGVPLRWELNLFFKQTLRKKLYCFVKPLWSPCHAVVN